MMEICHQVQFAGCLYYVKPIKRAVGQVVGLHEGVFKGQEFLFAIYFSIRYFLIRRSGNQVHFAVLLFKVAGYYRVGFQDGVEGVHDLLCAYPIREGEDTGQIVGRGGRVLDAIQIQTHLLEGEFPGFIGKAFLCGLLGSVLGHQKLQDVIFNALQAGSLGKAVHVGFQAVAFVQFGGQAEGAERREAAIVERFREAEAADSHALLDKVGQLLFQYVEWGHMLFLFPGLRFRLGEGLYVHFLVHVKRNGIYLHGNGRHHVRRFLAADKFIKCLNINFFRAHQIGCQKLSGSRSRLVKGLYGNILDSGEFTDYGFHFLELDPEAADLHLTVFPAHEFNFPIGPLADDVSRAVHPGIVRIFFEGVVQEHLGRFVRTVQVAQSHLVAGYPQFPVFPLGYLPALFVHHIGMDAGKGKADGDVVLLHSHVLAHHVADAFRGAVAVEKPIMGQGEGGHLFASGPHDLQSLAVRIVDGELRGHLGGHEAACDAVFFKIGVQGGKVQPQAFGDDVQGSPGNDGGI